MIIVRALSDDDVELTEITKKSKAYLNFSLDQIEKNNDLTITKNYIEQNNTYKLMIDDKIIGYYSFIDLDKVNVKLDNIFVLPEYIRNGYGSMLMDDLFGRLKQNGIKKVVLYAEPKLEKFYMNMGFNVIGQLENYIKNRLLPVMEKELVAE